MTDFLDNLEQRVLEDRAAMIAAADRYDARKSLLLMAEAVAARTGRPLSEETFVEQSVNALAEAQVSALLRRIAGAPELIPAPPERRDTNGHDDSD